ncbi:SAS complex, SAS5 subunit/transcription initiation factor IID, subunit 14 [Polychaeton citri CBS 116435]|uniref:SAS complex, SAS5 subunit/transcription initiation factor IID, subunit 14 n=1 Tax=Polychaeton citri CBS 116435 TaxID=1314669 RepID=A0A9P4Q5Y3_9PEZI|nr:SAS complex, SAS5 subunit/transcription initiation factor IID, subunit 14 [Polychaeton citri CBS 116435]
MPDIKRTVKLVTEQHVLPDEKPEMEGFPMREWSINVFLVNAEGDDVPANCFEKVEYRLHESFGNRATQVFKKPSFAIREKGWGEFDMQIVMTPVGAPKGGQTTVSHDLNFQQEMYESTHTVNFRNPKSELLERLRESGPVGEVNGTAAAPKSEKKRQKANRNVDMEKLAEALPQLGEEDLLQVVQMVHDNKTEDTYTKNDIDNGEFHVDLYTLPDNLIKMLWDFTTARVDVNSL